MPHQPRFDWQLWFSALREFEVEYYLIHFAYKILNNDVSAISILDENPFEGAAPPTHLRIYRDHYQFTDYKNEKVTFGLRTILTKLPYVINLLPTDL